MTNTNPSTIVPTFTAEPLTENCQEVSAQGEHVLVGVSPGNSYFSEQRLTELFRWAGSLFRRVDVMIPDSAQRHTWLALGYQPNRARRKSHAESSRILNRANRAWQAAEVPGVEFGAYRLSEIEERPSYQELLRESEKALADDPETRESYHRVVRKVLRNHLAGAEPTEEQAAEAARYLIAETPFLISTPQIMGVSSSTAIYQHRLEFVDRIYAGQTPLRRNARQAFVVARPVS
ncbi:tRNA-dependent cyclodipeptide synthase [Streptomyces sp. AC536]|uniref:tRNA-dependent cyclodipeptide synthase n=1 Tax=Streptomyces buecherae TaxID=2763006 RepID=UPI00164E4E10|nr:tRNA-dependent cyclodipeptide synthase [Streptomyces buecherae]MBC3983353.1 tRNA-dependent cyclodipeptide synthase [Streptomyces buecherae]QNJ41723.1 tRNA-dependent cyclodipeptide synthase [Streptomyces buecherae]